jgi:hypothetical protein
LTLIIDGRSVLYALRNSFAKQLADGRRGARVLGPAELPALSDSSTSP